MYVCPDCKTPLKNLRCETCSHHYSAVDGIPILFSKDEKYRAAAEIGAVYDKVYDTRTNVWEDQGRTPEFIHYFSHLLAQLSASRILEIGCGEGFLLAAIPAQEKVAIDISIQVLKQAKTRASAECSVALAERLPFPDDSFDLAASVGVMEHFLDDREATREIRRVLKPRGHYVALIHVDLNFRQSLAQKISEYLFPRFRPIALTRYVASKFIHPIRQPIQRPYTVESAKKCLEESGFRVNRIISKATEPGVPVIGPHVVIYIAQK